MSMGRMHGAASKIQKVQRARRVAKNSVDRTQGVNAAKSYLHSKDIKTPSNRGISKKGAYGVVAAGAVTATGIAYHQHRKREKVKEMTHALQGGHQSRVHSKSRRGKV